MTPHYSPGRTGSRARPFRAHRGTGGGDRRAARAARGHRGRGRGQDGDDGRPGGVAGRQRLRPARRGARADVHPQGRGPAAAPGPHPAGAAGRRRPRSRRPATSADDPATVSTYHAFAGNLLREHGLLLPVEPDTRLLSETELWQLAFRVVCEHPEHLDTDKTPAAVTAMVLRLAGQLAEHLVDTDTTARHPRRAGTAGAHAAGRASTSATAGPASGCCGCWPPRPSAAELVPLIDALHARMRAEKVMDFGMQMASAARLASTFPQVGAAAAAAVPGGAARRVPGHRARAAGRAVVAVRRRRRRRPGADRRRRSRFSRSTAGGARRRPTCRGSPPTSRGADGTPAPTLELRTSWRNPPRALHLANAVSAEARRRSVAVRALRPRPDAQPGTIRCALLSDVAAERDWVADHVARDLPRRPQRRLLPCRRRRCWCAATPTPRRWPTRLPRAASRSRSSGWPACWPCPRSPTWWRRCGWSPIPPPAPPRCGCSPGRGGGWAAATSPRCGDAPSNSTTPADATHAHRPSRSWRRPPPTPTRPAWPTRSAIPGRRTRIPPAGHRRIVALGRELTALRAHLSHPLPDLVAEVRRVLGVDTEVRAARPVSAGWSGTEHLDAFADVVADFAAPARARRCRACWPIWTPPSRWRTAWRPPRCPSRNDRVQILTVHAAKGLEWQVVAVPHLSGRVFPSTASTRTWLTDAGDLPPLLRGDRATVVRARRPGARHRQTSTIESGCPTRSPITSAASSSAASTRSAGCCTWRSPAPRTPCCCRVIIGAAPRPNPAARPISSASSRTSSSSPTSRGRPMRRRRTLGTGARPTVSRTRCATGRSKRSGPPTPSARRGRTWTAARRW